MLKLFHIWLLTASLEAQVVKNLLQCRRPEFDPWVGKIPWRRKCLPTPVFLLGEFHGQRSLGVTKFGHDWVTNTFSWLIWHIPFIVGFWAISHFWHYKILHTHLLYLVPALRIIHFTKSFDSFYWRIMLETKIWVLSMLIASISSQLTMQGNICV